MVLIGMVVSLQRKRPVMAVLMKGVRVMYPHNSLWIHKAMNVGAVAELARSTGAGR